MRNFTSLKHYLIYFTLLYFFTQIGAKRSKPPEVDEDVRTQFKIPAGTKPFKLSCPVKNSEEDEVIVRWSKDDEEITTADWGSQSYRLLNSNLDLKIRNPQVSDSGHYKCMAINGFGHKKVEFTLQVYDANFIQKQDATEMILLTEQASSPIWYDRNSIDFAIKKPVRLSRGQRLELRCPASGSPLPKIYWSKNGVRVNIELINPTSAKFVIDNVDVDDSGIYTCRLENSYGSLEADFRVYVRAFDDDDDDFAGLQNSRRYDNLPSAGVFGSEVVKSGGMSVPSLPQPIIDQPNNSTVRAGHVAQFQCKVQWRKDAPTIRWLRKIDNPGTVKAITPNATILHINDMHLMVLEQNKDAVQIQENNNNDNNIKIDGTKAFLNKLLIANVQPHDSGRYFCVVTNAVGQFVFRSTYLEVVEAGRFSPLTNSMNVIIAVVIALVLTVVTLAVVWLCYNSTSDPVVKNISLAAPHQFSSTSSTSSSASCAEKYPKSLSTALITAESAAVEGHEGLKRAIFSEPPPPPPQIPLPKAPLITQPNLNVSNSIMSPQQQLLIQQQQFLHHQQQQQRLLENQLVHHSQMHLHHDVSSPLLGGGPHHPSHNMQNVNTSIGELLYPSSMTLDRRYTNQQRMNTMFNPYAQQQQHILHRTKAEDEMSRLSSHIYDLLAVSSPLPPHNSTSPSLVRHHHQNNNNNNDNLSYHQQQDTTDWSCGNKYAPPPAPPLPPSLPPPPHARPTTPASTIGESDDLRRFVEAENMNLQWNNSNIPQTLRPSNTSRVVLNDQQFHQPRRQTQISVGDGTTPR